MNRINHILVVVDPTTEGRQAAVDKAAHLARCNNASVELLICDIASALKDQRPPDDRRPHPNDNEILDLLDGLARPLRAQGTKVTVRIIYGISLPDTLLDYLRGSNADLVIKDTHPQSSARRIFVRNTDWHLMRGCSKPLLLTKAKAWGKPPVVVTAVELDDEMAAASNHHILDFAASLARGLKGDLHIIHTYIPMAFAAIVGAVRQSLSHAYSEALQVENAFRYSQIESLGSAYGVSPQHLHVEAGTPHDCLKQVVKQINADLTVVGTLPHSWHRMFIGSTAATILESLDCDILIVGTSEFAQSPPV
jgi:universal stress protein E